MFRSTLAPTIILKDSAHWPVLSLPCLYTALSKNCKRGQTKQEPPAIMGNDNDRTSIVTHVSKNIEQPVASCGVKHCCRLIQDQDPCSTIQHLHNFNCLFFRNGHFVDFFGKVQIKTIFIDQFLNIFGYFFILSLALPGRPNTIFSAAVSTSTSLKC